MLKFYIERRPSKAMPQESSIGIILFNKNKYLLLNYEAGHWGFPKGNKEKYETDEETARRELKEETGITAIIIPKEFQEKEEYFYKKEGKTIHKEVLYVLAETQETNVTLSKEHTDYKWVTYEEAMNLLTFSQGKELLKKAEEFKKYH